MIKELRIYRTHQGKEPFSEWFLSIKDKVTKAQIKNRINRLILGNYGDCKFVGNGVCELRIHYGAGYRIYFAEIHQTTILLLIGGDKHAQEKDIEKAKKYWFAFKEQYHE